MLLFFACGVFVAFLPMGRSQKPPGPKKFRVVLGRIRVRDLIFSKALEDIDAALVAAAPELLTLLKEWHSDRCERCFLDRPCDAEALLKRLEGS
jgi:hypothetical protein